MAKRKATEAAEVEASKELAAKTAEEINREKTELIEKRKGIKKAMQKEVYFFFFFFFFFFFALCVRVCCVCLVPTRWRPGW